jgi:hypothetical protein
MLEHTSDLPVYSCIIMRRQRVWVRSLFYASPYLLNYVLARLIWIHIKVTDR